MTEDGPRDGPRDGAVQDTMVRALAILRVILLLNTLALGWYRRDSFLHPWVALTFFVILTAWTAYTVWAYSAERRRRWPLLVADLAVAVGGVALSSYVKGPELTSTLPGFWVMAVALSWAVRWQWIGGLVAAVAISVADVAIRPDFTQTNYGNVFALLIAGPLVGLLAGLLQDMARQRDQAQRAAATAAERARLARVVHDGVLQVLSLVQRRGAEIGGDAAELGRLAGEQEVALRALVQRTGPAPERADGASAGEGTDLAAALLALQGRGTPKVEVAVPGGVVPMSEHRVEEVVAVVRACLHNVSDHVGRDARAWILLEDLGDEIAVSVRDEGPGIASGRLDEAASEGRLGVSESIRGRVDLLGGTASLHSAVGRGTEWEFTFPRLSAAPDPTARSRAQSKESAR